MGKQGLAVKWWHCPTHKCPHSDHTCTCGCVVAGVLQLQYLLRAALPIAKGIWGYIVFLYPVALLLLCAILAILHW